MIKNNNKSQKEIPIAPDISKHKKKKEKKDKTPWNKHKHKYSIVLLEYANSIDGTILNKCPSKVCTICGRVDSTANDEKYYVSRPLTYLPFKRKRVHYNVQKKELLGSNKILWELWHICKM